jgi:hypothetical protein
MMTLRNVTRECTAAYRRLMTLARCWQRSIDDELRAAAPSLRNLARQIRKHSQMPCHNSREMVRHAYDAMSNVAKLNITDEVEDVVMDILERFI